MSQCARTLRGMGNPSLNASLHEYPPAIPLPSAAAQRAQRLATGNVIIISGQDDYQDRDRVFAALDLAYSRKPITLLVHGAALDPRKGELIGVDRWADEWARARGVAVESNPADRATWGRSAEAMRNKQMCERGAHGCIAFPGGAGTACTGKHATWFEIPVWRPFG